MKRTNARNPPFAINRNDARSLLDQVADGLRAAIVGGYYGPGDEIPSSRELCPLLGVSRIVTSAALERLVGEGYVLTRHGLHPVVRDLNAKQWRGRVLFVYADITFGYFLSVFAETLRGRLTRADWLFSRICLETKPDGSLDFSLLDAALAHSVDLVVVLFDDGGIFAKLREKGVPFAAVVHADSAPDGAVGLTRLDYEAAVPDFVAACRTGGIREVVQMRIGEFMLDAAPALHAAGIAVKPISLDFERSRGVLYGVEEAGFRAFERMVADGTVAPPRSAASRRRLFFFSDDYLARGALSAMAHAGLRTPEDVRVATWANAGLGPFHPRQISRMEIDPAAAGETAADAALAFLEEGAYPENSRIRPKWIPGETMDF